MLRVRLKNRSLYGKSAGFNHFSISQEGRFGVFDSCDGSHPEEMRPASNPTSNSPGLSPGDAAVSILRIKSATPRVPLRARTLRRVARAYLAKNRKSPSPLFCAECSVTPTTPNPYFTERRKLIDDASGKIFLWAGDLSNSISEIKRIAPASGYQTQSRPNSLQTVALAAPFG